VNKICVHTNSSKSVRILDVNFRYLKQNSCPKCRSDILSNVNFFFGFTDSTEVLEYFSVGFKIFFFLEISFL